MFRIAICDPGEEQRNQIEEYISRDTEIDDDYVTESFSDVDEVRNRLLEKEFGFDLLFLYIGGDGSESLSLAEFLRENHYDVDIWFMAESGDFVNEAFHHRAINYVKKPITYELFAQEMHQYIAAVRKYQKDILVVQIQGKDQVIPLRAVVYFSSDARKVGAFFSQDDKEIWFYEKMDQLEKKLLPYGFVRTHQSYLINGRRIERLEGDSVVTAEGEFPISRKYLTSVRERWELLQQEKYSYAEEDKKNANWSDAATVVDEGDEELLRQDYGVVFGIQGCGSQSHRIYHDEVIAVGRDTTRCQVVVDNSRVSRLHCQIRFDEEKQCYFVKDSSKNGTFSMQTGRMRPEEWVELKRDSILRLTNAGCTLWLG